MSRAASHNALARRLFWIFKNGPAPASITRRALGDHWMPRLVARGYLERIQKPGFVAAYTITERGRKRLELEMRRAGTGGEYENT